MSQCGIYSHFLSILAADMPDHNQPDSGGPPPLLLAAIEKILRPLVNLMLSFQITYPQLITLLKSIYVDVAEKEFQVNGKRQSDSRINLLTGVHRKDVKRLRAETRAEKQMPANVSSGARIIGQWLGTPEFLDAGGNPRPLPLKSPGPESPGFQELVEKVCKQDIRPRVILDEWLRLGVAHIKDEHVLLNTGAFTPENGFDEKVFFFGKNTQDHINAGSRNLLGHKPSYFDRSVYYDKLSGASIEELGKLADKLGMRALTEMNQAALTRQKRDQGTAGANCRMNFGVFNYNTETTSETVDKETEQADSFPDIQEDT